MTKCWEPFTTGVDSLTALKNIFGDSLQKKKKKKGKEKEKRLFENPGVINLGGAFPIKFFIRWLHNGQRANKHR